MTRWQAAGMHLTISAAIAAAAIALILGLWFPGPLFEAAGGLGLLYILVGVDVVLGPLLTLIVFKSGKRGMKFDLAVIGSVQFAALVYGCAVVFLARPAFVVFVKDRFELVTAVDLAPQELAAARFPEFRSVPLTGPAFAAADMPEDPAERQKLIELAASGIDVQNFPRYFVPYAERAKEVLAKAQTVASVRTLDPPAGRVVDEYLVASGTDAASVRCLLLRTRFAWIAVLVDSRTAQPVKMLIAERIR